MACYQWNWIIQLHDLDLYEIREKLSDAKEIQHEIELEEKEFVRRNKEIEDLGFRKYLHSNNPKRLEIS